MKSSTMFEPKHTYQSVARDLAEGLSTGRIVLPTAPDSTLTDRDSPGRTGVRGFLSQVVFLGAYLALGVASLSGPTSLGVVAVSYVLLGVSHYASMVRR